MGNGLQKKREKFYWIGVGVAGICIISIFITIEHFKQRKLDLFQKNIFDYMYCSYNPNLVGPISYDEDNKEEGYYDHRIYIKGKIITIDFNENKIDRMYYDLPRKMRASNPNEVGTVLWLVWEKKEAGEYTSGETAYTINCQVTIIDETINKPIAKINFYGSLRSSKAQLESAVGEKPIGQIVDFLKRLPQR